jgi:hypothetical protein
MLKGRAFKVALPLIFLAYRILVLAKGVALASFEAPDSMPLQMPVA